MVEVKNNLDGVQFALEGIEELSRTSTVFKAMLAWTTQYNYSPMQEHQLAKCIFVYPAHTHTDHKSSPQHHLTKPVLPLQTKNCVFFSPPCIKTGIVTFLLNNLSSFTSFSCDKQKHLQYRYPGSWSTANEHAHNPWVTLRLV